MMTMQIDYKIYQNKFYIKVVAGHNNCWQWTASKSKSGYGFFQANKLMRAHRYSYLLHKGAIPSHLVIDHICRNRLCVNPQHLRLVTNRENLLCGDTLAAKNKAKTHCKKGHEFTDKNTNFYHSRGSQTLSRECRACKRSRRDYKLEAKICEFCKTSFQPRSDRNKCCSKGCVMSLRWKLLKN